MRLDIAARARRMSVFRVLVDRPDLGFHKGDLLRYDPERGIVIQNRYLGGFDAVAEVLLAGEAIALRFPDSAPAQVDPEERESPTRTRVLAFRRPEQVGAPPGDASSGGMVSKQVRSGPRKTADREG